MKNKINAWRLILAGILFAVIAEIIHILSALLSMKYYTMPEYFSVWSKVMMPSAGPPPASFYYYSFVFAAVTGIILAYMYSVLRKSLEAKSAAARGVRYGMVLFFVSIIPFSLSLYLLINLPLALIFVWAAENLVLYILGGMVIAKLNK